MYTDQTEGSGAVASAGMMVEVQYTGWLASRWSDPSFPHHFPWFASVNYFEQQCQLLEQQLQLVMK